jgi:Glyoxalase-like domain
MVKGAEAGLGFPSTTRQGSRSSSVNPPSRSGWIVERQPIDRSRDEEVAWLVALRATPVDVGQDERDWVVLADPEGNEFCVLRAPTGWMPSGPADHDRISPTQ